MPENIKVCRVTRVKYVLKKAVLGTVPEVTIDEAEYRAYQNARNSLINAFEIEEKYEILIANYFDFEKQIVDGAATSMVRNQTDYSDFFGIRLALNIRLVNLLTATRLYIDQVKQDVPECLHQKTALADVKKLLASEYDGHAEFRFMEALRNYVQHRGLPVHLVSLPVGWTELPPDSPDAMMEFSLEVHANRATLIQDVKFPPKVSKEIPERVDLKAAARRYVECLSRVHASLRNLISKSVDQSRELLEAAHQRYAEVYKESLVGLSAVRCDGETWTEEVPLLLDWDDVRKKLVKRNGQLVNLSKRFISSKIDKK
jgi:hypothetical protein